MENRIKTDIILETLTDKNQIKNHILYFNPIFPHLKEKISSFDEYAEKLSKKANVVIEKINDEPVGLLVFYANDFETRTAFISLIGVSEKWQGKNVSAFLLEYCTEESVRRKMEFLKLEVDIDNGRAIRFYEKNGFKKCGEAGGSSIYMCKRISEGKI